MADNRNRASIIGKTNSGKTTLAQYLSGESIRPEKTQALHYRKNYLDIPGEFVDVPFMRHQAINVSKDCGLVLLVCSATDRQNKFSPFYVFNYNLPTIGVVTKIDDENADVNLAKAYLRFAGVKENQIILVSAFTGEGMTELEMRISHFIRLDKG